MPYDLFTKVIKGQKKYCMRTKSTGKVYCYKSKSDRATGMKMHHAFDSGWKPTGKTKT